MVPLKLHTQVWRCGKLVQESGSNKRVAVLIAHGLMGSITNWYLPAKELSRRLDVDVIACDMRNHGRSPHSSVHNSLALASDLALMVRSFRLDYQSIVLMGHSMGGTAVSTALLTAAATSEPTPSSYIKTKILGSPFSVATQTDTDLFTTVKKDYSALREKVTAAIIVDQCPENFDSSPKKPAFLLPFKQFYFDLLQLKSLPLTPELNLIDADVQLKKKIPNDAMRGFLLSNLVSGDPRKGISAFWRCNLPVLTDSLLCEEHDSARKVRSDIVFPYFSLSENSPKIVTPTLHVFGERSPYNTDTGRSLISQYFDPSTFQEMTLSGCGHYPHYERRSEFIDTIIPFIEAHI